jgi:class 3 adenylate cyclase
VCDINARAGLHIGEIEATANDVNGIAVHVAARATAAANQVLVSSTVKDLVVGSNIKFQDQGSRRFKGLDGKIRLFEVVAAS